MLPKQLKLLKHKIYPISANLAKFPSFPDGRQRRAIHIATVGGQAGGRFKTYVLFEAEAHPSGQFAAERYLEEIELNSMGYQFKQIADDVEWKAVLDFLRYQGIGGDKADYSIRAKFEAPIRDTAGIGRDNYENTHLQAGSEMNIDTIPGNLTRDEEEEERLRGR